LPPIGTAGFDRVAVSGNSRVTLTTAKDDRKRVAGHCPHHHTCKSVARRLRWFVWRYPGAVAINLSSTSGSAGLVR
jgi:hypothetical protein